MTHALLTLAALPIVAVYARLAAHIIAGDGFGPLVCLRCGHVPQTPRACEHCARVEAR